MTEPTTLDALIAIHRLAAAFLDEEPDAANLALRKIEEGGVGLWRLVAFGAISEYAQEITDRHGGDKAAAAEWVRNRILFEFDRQEPEG